MQSTVTEGRPKFTWGWEEEWITNGKKEIFGDDGSVCCFDCGHGFTGLNIHKTDKIEYFRYFLSYNYTLVMLN